MRYPASAKLEIIRLVEQSTLPVQRTLNRSAFPNRRSTHGMIATSPVVSMHLRIIGPNRAVSGTASLMMCARRSSNSRSMNQI